MKRAKRKTRRNLRNTRVLLSCNNLDGSRRVRDVTVRKQRFPILIGCPFSERLWAGELAEGRPWAKGTTVQPRATPKTSKIQSSRFFFCFFSKQFKASISSASELWGPIQTCTISSFDRAFSKRRHIRHILVRLPGSLPC